MLPKYLFNLIDCLESEFETHYIEIQWLYRSESGLLTIGVDYPLTDSPLVLQATLPKTNKKEAINFLKRDFIDTIYQHINKSVKLLGYTSISNIQKRKEE